MGVIPHFYKYTMGLTNKEKIQAELDGPNLYAKFRERFPDYVDEKSTNHQTWFFNPVTGKIREVTPDNERQ